MNRQESRHSYFQAAALSGDLPADFAVEFRIRWRFLDLPLERDEGEYAYAGQLILQGIPPYQLAYNMKFPGVYFAYAGLMSLFGQIPAGIHDGIILVTSLSIVLIFLIGCELMMPSVVWWRPHCSPLCAPCPTLTALPDTPPILSFFVSAGKLCALAPGKIPHRGLDRRRRPCFR